MSQRTNTGRLPEGAVPLVPAPWELKGSGYVFLLRPNSEPKQAEPTGLGFLMLVSYKEATAGPYDELVLVKGAIRDPTCLAPSAKQRVYTVSRIWVSTKNSVVNGRRNWGVPKQLAKFLWRTDKTNGDVFGVSVVDDASGATLLDVSLTPVTSLLPKWIQPHAEWLLGLLPVSGVPARAKYLLPPSFRSFVQPRMVEQQPDMLEVPLEPETWLKTTLDISGVFSLVRMPLLTADKGLFNDDVEERCFRSVGIKVVGSLEFPVAKKLPASTGAS